MIKPNRPLWDSVKGSSLVIVNLVNAFNKGWEEEKRIKGDFECGNALGTSGLYIGYPLRLVEIGVLEGVKDECLGQE